MNDVTKRNFNPKGYAVTVLRDRHAPESIMLDEEDAGRRGRDQIAMRLCTKRSVRVFQLDQDGKQPEHLMIGEVAEACLERSLYGRALHYL